jgi:alpha-amylase/alpha-mannosidase (GH57 family)
MGAAVSVSGRTVDLLFLWHHHQPDYRSPRDGRAVLPWVRLHATKDYLDMALHLERHPGVKAAFNFVPSLLDQLDAVIQGGGETLVDLLRRPVAALTGAERLEVASRCAIAPRHALERWPRYRALARRLARAGRDSAVIVSDPELLAAEVWFLLAWIDPLHHDREEVADALAAGGDYTEHHRDRLIALSTALCADVVPAYRRLAERGQIELSASPYNHPILPLLVDITTARRARPDCLLPRESFAAPEDAALQIARALDRHATVFGARPAGMWPPEGSVSPETAELAARAGIRWLASDEAVLWNSRPAEARVRDQLYRPWRTATAAGDVVLFFRDHELSDRIGFVYQHWDAVQAVDDFLARVRRIAEEYPAEGTPLVTVILDGENCWESYAEDGGPFLDRLYAELEAATDIRTVTPSEAIAARPVIAKLERLHSGSWIDADFHIWVGHPEKNRAWDLVALARRALVDTGAGPADRPQAWDALLAAEGSDWFWWFGDDHFTADKALFDRILREHLQAVYERSDLPVPGALNAPIAVHGPRRPASLQPLGFLRPTIDGQRSHYYEWEAAGRHAMTGGGTAMHRGQGMARRLYFGFDAGHFYLRLDFHEDRLPGEAVDLALDWVSPRAGRLLVRGLVAGEREVAWSDGKNGFGTLPGARCALGRVLELAVPFEPLGLRVGESVEIAGQLLRGAEPIEAFPWDDLVRFTVPDPHYEDAMWSA